MPLKMKYYVFKLARYFDVNEIIKQLQNSNFEIITGKSLAEILLLAELEESK